MVHLVLDWFTGGRHGRDPHCGFCRGRGPRFVFTSPIFVLKRITSNHLNIRGRNSDKSDKLIIAKIFF